MDWPVIVIYVALGGVILSAVWGAWCLCRTRHLSLTKRLVIGLTALAAGVGLTFVEYQPSMDVKVFGLPLPVAIFQFERGYWIDYVTPLAIPIMVLNVVITSGAIGGLIAFLARRRARAAGLASSAAAKT
jgi:hypothetical protein